MNSNDKLNLMKDRINRLENRNDKNIKSGGVLRKLRRQLRNMESTL